MAKEPDDKPVFPDGLAGDIGLAVGIFREARDAERGGRPYSDIEKLRNCGEEGKVALTAAWSFIEKLRDRPVPMLIWCPECGARHIDEGEFETKVHHTHACQGCGHCWRPAIVATTGVRFLPGFKND